MQQTRPVRVLLRTRRSSASWGEAPLGMGMVAAPRVMVDACWSLSRWALHRPTQPQPGNRNDCLAYSASRIDRAAGGATVLADGGYQGTGLLIPHRRRAGQTDLPPWKERTTPTTAGSEPASSTPSPP